MLYYIMNNVELLVEAFNLEHAKECIKNKIPNLILGNEIFASRLSYSFNESEIQSLVNNKSTTKIWIKVNTFFFENEINRLIAYLRWLSRIKVDYVIFSDFAVVQINDELDLKLNLHYNPETIVCSYGQLDFYKKCNFTGVFLAKEIMWNELEEISKNKNGIKIEIQGHGYGFIMHSRWKLINNFYDYYQINKNDDQQFLKIKEKLRKIPNLIFEDRHGTHMLTGYLISSLNLIEKLKKINIDYLKLDFLFTNEDYAKKITNLYQDVINNKILINKACDLMVEYSKDFIISNSFLGGYKDILHLEKEDSNEK